jgi:hypothetical protein
MAATILRLSRCAAYNRESGTHSREEKPIPVSGANRRICAAASKWEGVETAPHRFGGVEFRLGKREIGHIHGDSLVDIPFPKRVRDEIVAAHEAEPHHILPNSGWVSLFLHTEDDVDRAIRLLERSFLLAQAHHAPAAERDHGEIPGGKDSFTERELFRK